MKRFIGFIARMVALMLLALIFMGRGMGIPMWGSVLMLVVSFVLYFYSTKAMK